MVHFALVHDASHGAWYWFKLTHLLKEAGHRVTTFDLSASGVNPKRIDELRMFLDYSRSLTDLMESIPPEEKVVLVGHSLGGLNVAFAIEKYHDKISLAAFVAALMPKIREKPSFILEKGTWMWGGPWTRDGVYA